MFGYMAQGRRRGGAPPAVEYLNDLSPAPVVAWSLRRVISGASLSIRVRRSSDNAQQDIGFSGDELDVSSLLSFAGAGNAFIVQFYDQTGGGIHLAQSTAARQPRIVNAGSYDGSAVFSSSELIAPSVTMGTPYLGLHMKAAQANQSAICIMAESSSSWSSFDGSFVWFMLDDLHQFGTRGNTDYFRRFSTASITSLSVISLVGQMAVADGTTPYQRMWVNGSSISPVSSSGTPSTPPQNFSSLNIHIGARSGVGFPAPVRLHTLAIYNADTTSSRAAIEGLIEG